MPSDDRQDSLLSPMSLQAAKHLRGGGSVRRLAHIRWSEDTARLVHDHVCQWLRTGDPGDLAALLKEFPGALAHPAVATSFGRMRALARKIEIAELTGEADLDGEWFSLATCKLAQATLVSLTTALVSALIGGDWSLERQRKRGRPTRSLEEIGEAHSVLGDHKHVLRALRRQPLKWNKRESPEQCYRRLRPILRRVWSETIGVEIHSESPRPGADLFDTKIIRHPIALTDEDLRQGIDAAVSRPGYALRRDVIAYHLVGVRWNKEPISVRHLVEVAHRDLDK